MIVFDFFSGTGSSTQAFKDAGHTVISFELDSSFEATENVDVMTLKAADLIAKYGQPDFIWASPPCTAFSVASMGHHWMQGGANPLPRTEAAKMSQELVAYTRDLIKELNPTKGWLMENPRGMLRKLPVVEDLPRRTVTYCTYGDSRMKPTDLWGGGDGLDTSRTLQEWSRVSRSCTARIEDWDSRTQRRKRAQSSSLPIRRRDFEGNRSRSER
jgi:site-specific DNA-cytosine methylase